MERENDFPSDVEVFVCHNVDFTRESFFRRFKIEVDGTVFFVNAHMLSQASPVFEAMLTNSRFVERSKSSATLVGETADDIHLLLRSICPTLYAIYPYPVDEWSFPTLARLADKFLISGLRTACEQLVVQPKVLFYSTEALIRMLDSVHHSGYSKDIQHRLMLAILRKPIGHLRALNGVGSSPTYRMLINTFKERSPLNHKAAMVEVRGILCEICKFASRQRTNLHMCSSCKLELCGTCLALPCSILPERCIDSIDTFI